jgi:hypothetical protein
MKLPVFCKQDGEKILFNQTGELLYYIPEKYFQDTKTTIAKIEGQYVSTIGVFDWALVSDTGKVGKAHPFKYCSIFLCKPSSVEKVKNVSLNGLTPMDYRVCHFVKGDEVISDINTPKIVDNVEILFKAMIYKQNCMPPSIPYDKAQDYFPENMELNAKGYGLNMQNFGFMISELYRDPTDISKPFRLSKAIEKSMTGYAQLSIIDIPKYISPLISISSQNWDDGLMAAIQMNKDGIYNESPLNKVVTG